MNLLAAHALLPTGWARDVLIRVDGQLVSHAGIAEGRTTADTIALDGYVIPGMANLHSHAFQRAMAGLTEARTRDGDSFWTWRELMYGFAGRITPEQVEDLAAYLYVEMLKAGYTAVAEFHYIHRDPGGKPYADPAEMSHRIVAAAGQAGIALTHLPVLYHYGGFGQRPAAEGQERFLLSVAEYAALLARLRERYGRTPDVRIGAAFHSLRAVDPRMLEETLAALDGIDATAPVHIHIAEQEKEVEDCLAWCGQRPVEWLIDHIPVDRRWCLVHATHLDAHEIEVLARSGAVAGLCPTTEANLGDGIFPARDFLDGEAPGRIGIGSDSHVSVSVAGELRLLEYGQRLTRHGRAVLATASQPSPGARLYTAAAEGGAQALGIPAGRIAPGQRADLVVLDPRHPALWNKTPRQALDAWIFAGDSHCVRDVMVGGDWKIRDGRHAREGELATRFRTAQAALLAGR